MTLYIYIYIYIYICIHIHVVLIVMVLHMSGYNDVHGSCAAMGLAMEVGGLGILA